MPSADGTPRPSVRAVIPLDPTRSRDVRSRLRALTAPDPDAADDPARPVPSGSRRPFGDALAVAAERYADAHGVLPVPHPEPARVRWRPSVRSALAGAVALALVAGAVVVRSVATQPGHPVTLPVPAPLASSPAPPSDATSGGAPGPTGPGATATAALEVVVDVAGEVVRPGVVRLPAGSRVVDAIEAAGGATGGADLARLNLARVLVDAEQVLVPRPGDPLPAGPTSGSSSASSAGALVDLNLADAATLDTLPGIGPVLAGRIVEHRTQRPFGSVDELVDVPGIGTALLEQLRDLVRV